MRGPDPLRECRPGGSCPTCNPAPQWCQWCAKVQVEDVKEPCPACAAAIAEEAALEEPAP